jgi:hypothetical protein
VNKREEVVVESCVDRPIGERSIKHVIGIEDSQKEAMGKNGQMEK